MRDIIFDKHGEVSPRISCLDYGFVTLVDCMPRLIEEGEETADYAIAEAARCSYKRGTKTISDDKALIRYLMRHNHTSPLEMIEFKFHCKMPMFVARQWIRHRTANVNELSGRYSELPEEYYLPETDNYRNQSVTNTQGSEGYIEESEARLLMEQMRASGEVAFAQYDKFLKQGLVREQSRMVLPLNTYTEWYWKIDLKNLLHFLNLRCDGHAQKEIQVYGNAILKLIKPIIPWTIDAWEDYSPYRGGMILTKYEVEALKSTIDSLQKNGPHGHPKREVDEISIENKLEKMEWKDKGKKLGFYDFDKTT